MRLTPEARTIQYLEHKVEVTLPEQLETAQQVLGRLSLKYSGQLALFEGNGENLGPVL